MRKLKTASIGKVLAVVGALAAAMISYAIFGGLLDTEPPPSAPQVHPDTDTSIHQDTPEFDEQNPEPEHEEPAALVKLPPYLRDVLWQVLDDRIESVYVGPDDRVWTVENYGLPYPDINSVRENIRDEFHKAFPLLTGCRPVLFEPDGRVWFEDFERKTLLGYDGHRFIERGLVNERWQLSCPGHGIRWYNAYSCITAGHIFFTDTNGVHTFNLETEEWSYEQMLEGRELARRYFLSVDPSGRRVISYLAEVNVPPVLSMWEEGRWTTLTIPMADDLPKITGMVAGELGVWASIVRADGKIEENLRLIPYDDLAADDPKPQDDPVFSPGPYRAEGISIDFSSYGQTIWFRAREIFMNNEPAGPGMTVSVADGFVGVALGEHFALIDESDNSFIPSPSPILVPGKNKAWIPGWYGERGAYPAKLHNLETGEVIGEMPCHFIWPHASLSDSALFASCCTPGSLTSLVAYRDGAEDDRQLLDAQFQDFHLESTRILADGSIVSKGRLGVMRFDGDEWQFMQGMRIEDLPQDLRPPAEASDRWLFYWRHMPIAAGRNGELLAMFSGDYILVVDGKLYRYKSNELKTLISEHRHLIVDSFASVGTSGTLGSAISRNPFGFIVDGAGNIWLNQGGYLVNVLVGDTWLDLNDFLLDVQLDDQSFVRMTTTIGDGRIMYMIIGPQPPRDPRAFYAEVVGDKIAVLPAPHPGWRWRMVKDNENRLWINNQRSATTYRLSGQFEEEVFEGIGEPVLWDNNGSLWLKPPRSGTRTDWSVWYDGEVRSIINIPSSAQSCSFFSDRPGSVYVFTITGIYHPTATDPARPYRYEISNHYLIRDMHCLPRFIGYSKLGYLVLGDSRGIWLVRLPAKHPLQN